MARRRPALAELAVHFDDVELRRAGSRFALYDASEPGTDRRVTVKVPVDTAGAWVNEVLEHEADVLVDVGQHPHLIGLHRRLRLDDGRLALVLRYCPRTLSEELPDDGRKPLRDALAIGIKLAGALECIHRSGYVHCDVRPQRIGLMTDDEPVLAGLEESVRRDADPTRPSLRVTTPYTAPELLDGGNATERSDVYGLASTLYGLIAGHTAFRAYVGESPAAMIVRVLSGTVKPIVLPDVPLQVSDLLTWAMAPDPMMRPPGPAWLAEELGRMELERGWPRTRLVTG